MASSELSYEETEAIFDELDRAQLVSLEAVAAAVASIGPSSPEPRSERTLRRVMKLGQFLLDREAVGLPIEFDDDASSDLAKRVGYKSSKRWVIERTHWFLIWRRKHQQKSSLVTRLLGQMWVPVFEAIPGFLLTGDGKTHSRTIRGRVFRWEESLSKRPADTKVVRCWFPTKDHLWLVREVFGQLPKSTSTDLSRDYNSLQRDCADYITRAARRRTTEEIGEDEWLRLYSVREAARLHYIGQSGIAFPQFDEAVQLATDPNRLEDRIGVFTDQLHEALDQWWAGIRTE